MCIHSKEEKCRCRKPNPYNLLKIKSDFNISLKRSWTIGDQVTDIETGVKAGTKTIALLSGKDKTFNNTRLVMKDLQQAVNYIIKDYKEHNNDTSKVPM